MGGFTDGTDPTPAPDYPPENNFDPAGFANLVGGELKKIGTPAFDGESLADAIAEGIIKVLAFSWKWSPVGVGVGAPLMDDPSSFYTKVIETLGQVIVKMVTDGGKPAMEILKDLTMFFTAQIVSELTPMQRGTKDAAPTGMSGGAQALFDGVMSPLMGLTSAANPATAGAGQVNAQYTLGGIMGIHLHTWMINILSNLTGVGVLKFINSFDECITGALNSRALGRGALKPYMEKFIATPLTRDLNVAMPLAAGSASQLIKRYIRGDVSNTGVKGMLRGLGYDDTVAVDMLLDAAKLLSVSACVYMTKFGPWTDDQAIQHLQLSGYPADLAKVEYEMEYDAKALEQVYTLADELVTYAKDYRMEITDLETALSKAGLTDAEVKAYSLRAAYAQEINKRLSYTQVKSLYAESLVDLNYVQSFLSAEGYTADDADLLILLEFSLKQDRDHNRMLLANMRRAQLEQGLKQQALADAARKAALALLPT